MGGNHCMHMAFIILVRFCCTFALKIPIPSLIYVDSKLSCASSTLESMYLFPVLCKLSNSNVQYRSCEVEAYI